jgi:anti-sigma-K factor RskA
VNDEHRDLAAGAALGALSADELARLEEGAARSPELASQLEEYRATVSMLEAGVARERPPDGLFEGVLARIEAETAAGAPSEAVEAVESFKPSPRRRERSWWRWPAFAAGAAAATAAAVLVLALTGGGDLGAPDARAAVSGTDEFPDVHGEARLYRSGSDDGVLVVDLADVPAPGPDEHYEVWVLRTEGGGAMEAVGAFSDTGGSVDLEFTLPGPGDYEAVDVSVEPNGGPAAHSGRSLAGGHFEPAT